MSSILEEFAYGNVSPDVQSVKKNSKYVRAMRLVALNEEKLMKRLEGEPSWATPTVSSLSADSETSRDSKKELDNCTNSVYNKKHHRV